jgi:cobalt/nickel transport system ATP-binding protein
MCPQPNAIEVVDLCYQYPDGPSALHHLNMKVLLGSKAALMGRNGAGKSTLLLHLNGILRAQFGTVTILNEVVTKNNASAMVYRVGVVFQNPDDQLFSPTVWEDVAFGPRNMGIQGPELQLLCTAALEEVEMLEWKDKPPHRLSYGQKKRVSLASILAMDPDIIVLDEPMAFLDPKGQDEILAILNRLHLRGKTVITATHDVDFALEWADYIYLMDNGSIIHSGGTEVLMDKLWIDKTHLHLPRVIRPFTKVKLLHPEQWPRNEEEAVKLLTQLLEP